VGTAECLDRLPRAHVGRGSRATPAYRACGVVGAYAGVAVLVAAGLLGGRPLGALGVAALAAATTFFIWAFMRRAVTRTERLVLVEHLWLALAAAAGAAAALGEPVLATLDALVPAVFTLLAAGRVGCLLVGCCHGRPGTPGIRYPPALVEDGFPAHLVGVRLLPVQLLEAGALAAIALAGLAGLAFATPGTVLAWSLGAYAAARFGLEELRGDGRPYHLGLSRNQWLCLVQLAVAVLVADGLGSLPELGVLAAGLAVAIVWSVARDPRLLTGSHTGEVRALALDDDAGARPALRRTSRGVLVGSSRVHGGLHVSLSIPRGPRDLEGLCALTAAALPELDPASVRVTGVQTLHVLVPENAPTTGAIAAAELYGRALRALQRDSEPPRERVAYFGAGV
jgi:Prolipoprotein diacylglyceryl transferase